MKDKSKGGNKKLSGSFKSIKQKADLVRGIDLGQVLDGTGAVKDKFDKAKWHTSKGTISVSSAKFMNWSKGIGGGGAIDLVMHLKNFDFKTAVLWLDNVFTAQHIQIPSNKMKPKPIQLPKKDSTKLPQVINYLVKIRAIPLFFSKRPYSFRKTLC